MSSRRASPVFVGRESQLGVLRDAYAGASAGEARAVFVGGEAGIGKTRLTEEFTAEAGRSGAQVLTGDCLELGPEGLPYAPFVAALRGLVRAEGTEAVTSLVPPGPLGRLLPDLASPATDEDDERGRLYEHVLLLFERLAQRRPLVLVVEDAHWADRSTRELLVFLVHNLASARVLLVVSFRSDELHRKHPLRPLLSELDRVRTVQRLDLPRLAWREVAEQSAAILDHDADATLVEDVYIRSEGNPLFVEAFLDCPDIGSCGITDTLRDLLLRGFEALPGETQQLLRIVSTSGLRAAHAELAAVSELGETALAAALRPAVDSQLLLPDGDGYRFRHALIREAIHEELLPGEHAHLHVCFAEVLERNPAAESAGATSELLPDMRRLVAIAHHWHAAHEIARAVPAAWTAAQEAARTYAHAERLALLERVLELWDRLPGAAELVGASHPEVLEEATEAADKSGEHARGVSFASAALAEIDPDAEPTVAAHLLQRRANMERNLGRPYAMEDHREAVRLTSAEPASRAHATALSTLALVLMTRIDDETAPVARLALTAARQAGDVRTEVHSLNTLAVAKSHQGDYAGALENFARARQIATEAELTAPLTRLAINESDVRYGAGEYHQALEIARTGLAPVVKLGTERTAGVFLAINIAEILVALGRWDEAEGTITAALDRDPPAGYAEHHTRVRAEIALLRGDVDTADRLATQVRTVDSVDTFAAQHALQLRRVKAGVMLARGEQEDALRLIEETLAGQWYSRQGRFRWPMLATGARTAADLVQRSTALQDDGAADGYRSRLDGLQAHARGISVTGPAQAAYRDMVAAECTRTRPEPDPAAWRAVAGAWERAEQPYERAYALFRAAEATVAAGESGAEQPLRATYEIATDLGALSLRADAQALARRARLSLRFDPDGSRTQDAHVQDQGPPAAHLGLTRRETDVLALLSAGRTNRQIAEELYISPKTASVHVSNILGKLGVSGRVEAAAVAYRLGMTELPAASAQ